MRKRSQFLLVYSAGEKFPGRFFYLYFLPNALSWNRLGITISRKVGDTVRRNRVRRKLKEIFRLQRQAIGPGVDVVINVRKSADGADYQSLEREFLRVAGAWNSRQAAGV